MDAYFTRYIALGDSMSIDLYPALDAGRDRRRRRARARSATAGSVAPLGAASLLYQNDDERWPDESGRRPRRRAIRASTLQNLATDGATIGDVFGEQLPQLDESDEPTLVTLTVGGNDLLSAFANKPRRALLERDRARRRARRTSSWSTLCGARGRTRCIVLTTVYDPSDRLGAGSPACSRTSGTLPLRRARRAERAHPRARATGRRTRALADVHAHFLGHGASACRRRTAGTGGGRSIEPNARGASEIRRVWLDALRALDD